MTRKLIKPNLEEIKKYTRRDTRKKPPTYKTHAENYYYVKQMNNKTHMVIELITGEAFKCKIEWYDEKCIKVKREDEKNFILFKSSIKYMYKDPKYTDQQQEKEAEE